MRAAICTRYGPPEVVEVRDVAKPTPAAGEVLVRVRATTVASGDARVRGLNVPTGFRTLGRLGMGIRGPRKGILGTELAGVVEAVGPDVRLFQPEDEVVASTGARLGAHAEYVCVSERAAVTKKPSRLSFDEAAAIPFGGLTALYFLRDLARMRPGEKLLVYGASGAVGTAAIQIGKHLGGDVSGVCSTVNVDLVRSLGADQVIDYTRDEFQRSGEIFDVIFDTVGKTSFAGCRASLAPNGRYLAAVATVGQFAQVLWNPFRGGQKLLAAIAPARKDGLVVLNGLVEAGELKAVIDRRYPLEEIVEAHRYVDGGHKRGNVVITIGDHDPSP